jgi:hypothetical protein
VLGNLETKKRIVLSGWCLAKHEACLAENGADVEMLECIGADEDDGELQSNGGEAGADAVMPRDDCWGQMIIDDAPNDGMHDDGHCSEPP